MTTVVLDSYALLAYLEKEPGWRTVTDCLTAAGNDEIELLLSVVNWGEIDYIVQRTYDVPTANRALHTMDAFPIDIRPADRALTRAAAKFKAKGGISYADCFSAALTDHVSGRLLTGDPTFEQLEDQLEIQWIDR